MKRNSSVFLLGRSLLISLPMLSIFTACSSNQFLKKSPTHNNIPPIQQTQKQPPESRAELPFSTASNIIEPTLTKDQTKRAIESESKHDLEDLEPAYILAPKETLWSHIRSRSGFVNCENLDLRARKRYQRFIQNRHSLLTRIDESLPLIGMVAAMLERHQLPAEFVMLPMLESEYRAQKSVGNQPAGIWQLMPKTAKDLGVPIRSDYDGRLDFYRSTEAAIDLLNRLKVQFKGDWRLVNMAYNAGEFRIKSAIKKQRKFSSAVNPYTLSVSRITLDHLAKLEALSCIVIRSDRLGLSLPELPPTRALAALSLDQTVNAEFLADISGSSLQRLQTLNPAWQERTTPQVKPLTVLIDNSGWDNASFVLRQVPKDRFINWHKQSVAANKSWIELAEPHQISASLLAAANLGTLYDRPINPASVWLPMKGPPDFEPNTTASTNPRPAKARHIVNKGDTLGSIARRYRVRLADLLHWNKLHMMSIIRPGQKLLLREQ